MPLLNRSFLVAGSDGLLALYEKSDAKESRSIYVRSDRKLPLNDYRGKVCSLVATPKQDELLVGLRAGLIMKIPLDKNEEPRC